ncbi:MAG TPA: TonB family protein [Thermoanaerobaculia bacterium]|nr:TonB family protein [Thermoanaerobaculia bacterium]
MALVLILGVLLLLARPRGARVSRPAASDSSATVTAEIADLRREPSATASPAGAIPKGARLTVVSDRGRWREVRTGKGETGFVPAEAIETDSERQSREERARKILSFTPVSGVVAEETDLLLAPFPSAPRAGRLRRGATIAVYGVDHDYYAVRADDGAVAFIHSSDVDLVPPDPRRPAIVPDKGKTIKDVTVTDLSPAPPEPPPPGIPAQSSPSSREAEAPAAEEPLEPAVLVSKVDPEYPEGARRAGVEGTVILDATISETGQVTQIAVERGLPLGVSEAAVAAVRRWKYNPARGRSGPVASHKKIRIAFSLGG